jgi:hypothetical protein
MSIVPPQQSFLDRELHRLQVGIATLGMVEEESRVAVEHIAAGAKFPGSASAF